MENKKRTYSISKFVSLKNGFLAVVFVLLGFLVNAQESVQNLIIEKDSVFWKAYNECDIATMENFLSADLEFYHDKNGIERGLENLSESLSNGLCKTGKNHLRREVVPNTVNVFPLKDKDSIYGAIITGEHLFYSNESGNSEGKAKFSHLWLLEDGKWKMHRVFSYDHHPAPYTNPKEAISLNPDQLKDFEGNYIMPSKDIIKVEAGKENLELTAMGKTFLLFPDSPNSFFTKDRDLSFSFSKELPHKVTIFEGTNKVAEATLSNN